MNERKRKSKKRILKGVYKNLYYIENSFNFNISII